MTDKEIHDLCSRYWIKNYHIHSGRVHVSSSCEITICDSKRGEIAIPFQKVSGTFDCAYTRLTTLHNGPDEVHGNYLCFNNYLTTLEHGPHYVKGSFVCYNNKSLSPEEILKWYNRGEIGQVRTDHKWLDDFLNYPHKNDVWQRDCNMLVRKLCDD